MLYKDIYTFFLYHTLLYCGLSSTFRVHMNVSSITAMLQNWKTRMAAFNSLHDV